MSYENSNPFSIAFSMMKIRYIEYDKTIDPNFVNRDDKINVFINFESVLNNLSAIKNIENIALLERNHITILESEIMNLAAHYKSFFRKNNLPTNVFFYYTTLDLEEYKNTEFNEDYRSYYNNKYLYNPRYSLIGNNIKEKIIPTVKEILQFIPNVYFVESSDIEGSLLPLIISQKYEGYKNFIVTSDKYDTQYLSYKDNFYVHYINRSSNGTIIYNTITSYLNKIFNDDKQELDYTLFDNKSFYSLLLSVIGNNIRSIENIKGLGPKTIYKLILEAIDKGKITRNTTNIQLLENIFEDEEVRNDIMNNYKVTDLNYQLSLLSEKDIFNIHSQIVDRFDFNSLLKLNSTVYVDYPLMLQELVS